jgi:hypothetical protein
LSGTIFTRIHQNANRHNGAIGQVLVKHAAGDIIGCAEINEGATTHADCWNLCVGATVEVARMSKEDFSEWWDIQKKRVSSSMVYTFLKL